MDPVLAEFLKWLLGGVAMCVALLIMTAVIMFPEEISSWIKRR